MQQASLLAAVLTAALSLHAQSAPVNMTLLSKLTNGASSYAAVWGYTAPDGREFAVVGAFNGTWIVETTDPKNPVSITTIPAGSTGSYNQWREMTGYGNHIYSVSEAQAGIRVIDMTNPTVPVNLGLVHSAVWANTHSIHCDPDQGRIYACGTNKGMYILDAKANPAAPPILGTFSTKYVHEAFVRRGKGYLAEIYSPGNIRIVNASNPAALATLSLTATPGAWTHNAWVTNDDQQMVTTGEDPAGKVALYDISNPAAPVLKQSYSFTGHIDHDVFGLGRTIFCSYYTDGVHVLDISNPAVPIKRIASYDTSTMPGPNYHGCWGVYPYTDSGVIYLSDIENGLYVVQCDVGHMNRYGKGTAGTNGVPRATFDGASPMVGAAACRLELANLEPNAPFVLVLGGGTANIPVLGITVLVDLNGAALVSGTADAQGKATMPLPIPANPGLATGKIYAQIVAAKGSGLIASRGMWFGIAP